jgi:hypothetical protein
MACSISPKAFFTFGLSVRMWLDFPYPPISNLFWTPVLGFLSSSGFFGFGFSFIDRWNCPSEKLYFQLILLLVAVWGLKLSPALMLFLQNDLLNQQSTPKFPIRGDHYTKQKRNFEICYEIDITISYYFNFKFLPFLSNKPLYVQTHWYPTSVGRSIYFFLVA